MWNPFKRKKKPVNINTRPPIGSRELVDLLAAEVEEKRLARSAAMSAYQKSLREGK